MIGQLVYQLKRSLLTDRILDATFLHCSIFALLRPMAAYSFEKDIVHYQLSLPTFVVQGMISRLYMPLGASLDSWSITSHCHAPVPTNRGANLACYCTCLLCLQSLS